MWVVSRGVAGGLLLPGVAGRGMVLHHWWSVVAAIAAMARRGCWVLADFFSFQQVHHLHRLWYTSLGTSVGDGPVIAHLRCSLLVDPSSTVVGLGRID